MLKKVLLCSSLLSLSACTVFLGSPEKRVKKFNNSELCTQLANKTFKFHAEWSWAISDEIKLRKLDSSERCKAAYNVRMDRFVAKRKVIPLSFEQALKNTVGAKINNKAMNEQNKIGTVL